MEHDPTLCFCDGKDICSCQCEPCKARNQRVLRLGRLGELEKRLQKANIDPDDFADLVWMRIEATIESRIEKLATNVMQAKMKDLRLWAKVVGSSIE